jgi:class 3 adenylate cyclase
MVTAVFCDVVGSTALGETADPEAMRRLLERYFERMRAIVEHHGGTVQKFIGDAVVAIFGVPAVHEDDALRALRAALEMRDALPGIGVEARIGVNTGEVMTSSDDALVTGDAVNVAARLQQAAGSGEVLLGEATRVLAGGAAKVELLDPLKLKGKAEPVPAFRLLAVGEPPERSHGARFVGRIRELALLAEAWERALAEARCELVTIVGEPGVGKSRLVAEFLAGLDTRVVHGRCLSYGEGITYWPVVEVLKQLGTLPAEPAAAGALRALLGDSDAVTSPDEIAWAFRKALEESAPLVVVFDDIQWGEETFLDLVEHVALLSAGVPLLLLCLARGELHERRNEWPIGLRLEPLPPGDVEALLPESLVGGLRERIARAAGGNPLFVTEMLAVASESAGEVVVPPTLKALLAMRIDQLEALERGVLERGAVEGEVFHLVTVQALAPGETGVVPRLAALVRKELIRPDRPRLPGEDGFRFCHLLVRDAAYDALPKAMRGELHERLGDWLDQYGCELVERDELVGYHLQEAHRYRTELDDPEEEVRALGERAAGHLIVAARRAAARADYRAASNLLPRALLLGIADPREAVRAQAELGFALIETRQRGDGEAVLDGAVAAAARLGERGIAARAQTYRVRSLIGDPDHDPAQVLALCEESVATLSELGDESGLANACRMLADVLQRQGQTVAAGAAFERALAHADASGDQEMRRLVIHSLTGVYLLHGPTPAGEAISRCARLLNGATGERVLAAEIRRSLGVLYAMTGRSDDALELLEKSSLVLDELSVMTATLTRSEAAYGRVLAGDNDGAEHELKTMWSLLHEASAHRIETRALRAAIELARLYCDERRFEEADEVLAYARDAPLLDDGRGIAARRLSVEALLAAQKHERTEAATLSEQAIERAEARPDDLNLRAIVWQAAAEVRRAAGEMGKAEVAIANALALYQQKGNVAAAALLRAAVGVASDPVP